MKETLERRLNGHGLSPAAIGLVIGINLAALISNNITFVAFSMLSCGTSLIFLGRRLGLVTLLRFLPVVAFGCIMLSLIYLVDWSSLRPNLNNITVYVRYVERLAVITLSICVIITFAQRRDFYAVAVRFRIPMPITYAFLRASWTLARIPTRSNDIILALKLRGVRLRGPISRLIAVGNAFTAILNATLIELEDATISLTQKGVFGGVQPSSLLRSRLRVLDLGFLAVCSFWALLFWWYGGSLA